MDAIVSQEILEEFVWMRKGLQRTASSTAGRNIHHKTRGLKLTKFQNKVPATFKVIFS